jgi:hypothetical protein
MQQASLTNSIEDNEGMTTGEIIGYAGLVGFATFCTTAITMYALRRMQK